MEQKMSKSTNGDYNNTKTKTLAQKRDKSGLLTKFDFLTDKA